MDEREIAKSGEGFIDRSKVRILLCDNDEKSSDEVFTLLCKCSYQVTAVKSPRQVIDALNAEGPDIDIILSEIDLPMSKGLKVLKYITRDKELRRIPVIMMSALDEVPIVVKCLKFGAADYLVKPLRTNELLNLWTHMWRRRRMLGLVEKNIINYDFDLVVSDHSDANTNSTTLFSNDTDDKSRRSTNPELCISAHQEEEKNTTTAAPTTEVGAPSECQPGVPAISGRRSGLISSFPRKSELKIGRSSAFLTYVKSATSKRISQGSSSVHENTPQPASYLEHPIASGELGTVRQQEKIRETPENHSEADANPSTNSVAGCSSMERSCTPPRSLDTSQQKNSKEFFQQHMHSGTESDKGVTDCYTHSAYPYYLPGVMNHAPMSSPSVYPRNLPDLHNHASSALVPHYNHIPQCLPHIPGMTSYPCYPFGICLQPGQVPAQEPWQSFRNSSLNEGGKPSKVDHREAALMKFRQKRKERCFDKKIRYVNRKKLAERRPRIRGQFVRKVNGITVDLNGQPASTEDDDEDDEEYDEEDQTANMDFSPGDDDASLCQ